MNVPTNRELASQWNCTPRHASRVRGLKAHTVIHKEKPSYTPERHGRSQVSRLTGRTREHASWPGRPRPVVCKADCKCPVAEAKRAKEKKA